MLELTRYQFEEDMHRSQRRLSWQQDDPDGNKNPTMDIRQFLDVKTEAKLWKSLEDLSKASETNAPEKSFRTLKRHRKNRAEKKQNLCRQQAFVFRSEEDVSEELQGAAGLKARSLVLTGKTKTIVASRKHTARTPSPTLYRNNFVTARGSASVSIICTLSYHFSGNA